MSNKFGKALSLTTYGESHGNAVGAIVDGCPSGLKLTKKYIQNELDRRRPGQSKLYSRRKEPDEVEILSGIFRDQTIGTPISMLVRNKDAESEDYEEGILRPGHADLSYELKYGLRDYRGGGRSSGRETVGRVCGGAIAKKLLSITNTKIIGHVKSIGDIVSNPSLEYIKKYAEKNPVKCGDPEIAEEMKEKIIELKKEGDSIGGIVEVRILNPPIGIGEPVFDKLESELARAIMSIGGIKGFEIGKGFESSKMRGSVLNDPYRFERNKLKILKNDAGGVLGGISTGENIVLKAAVKPTPSIKKSQKSVDIRNMEEIELEIEGRHDPCICPRVVPVVESMSAIVIADLSLRAGKIPKDKVN